MYDGEYVEERTLSELSHFLCSPLRHRGAAWCFPAQDGAQLVLPTSPQGGVYCTDVLTICNQNPVRRKAFFPVQWREA